MNIRLAPETEEQLNFFASVLHTSKTDLVKPYILRMLEDLNDYYHATQALKDEGTVSLDTLAEELSNVEN